MDINEYRRGPQHVTYLFGAGASYEALPTNAESADFLDRFATYCRGEFMVDQEARPLQMELWPELLNLVAAFPAYHSYDELAKHLLETGSELLEEGLRQKRFFPLTLTKVKVLMAVFYFLEQVRDKSKEDYRSRQREIKGGAQDTTSARVLRMIDSRIETFLVGLLRSPEYVDDRVRILSWNYDIQFELAMAKIRNLSGVLDAFGQDQLNVHPGRRMSSAEDYRMEPFYVHINGVAGLIRNVFSGELRLMDYGGQGPGSATLKELLERNTVIKRMLEEPEFEWSHHETFSFAWEDHWTTRMTHKYLRAFGEKTHDLVVFGYSMPLGNTLADLPFIRAFTTNTIRSKRIFLIDKSPNVNRLSELLDQALGSTKLRPAWARNLEIPIYAVHDVDRIPLPTELDALWTYAKCHLWTPASLESLN